MVALAVGIFSLSLACISLLFVLKEYESRAGLVVASLQRERADDFARSLKAVVIQSEQSMSTWIPKMSLICRYFIHRAALGLARVFNVAEQWAHKIADRVSHRHGFERRETRSQFLKDVSSVRAETLEKSEE